MTVVLDSWAIIRYLEDVHPAAGHVAELLVAERPLMSWINLGEVFYVIRRAAGEEAASSTLRDLRDVVSPEVPGESRIIEAARIKATHRWPTPMRSPPQRPSLTMRHCGPVIPNSSSPTRPGAGETSGRRQPPRDRMNRNSVRARIVDICNIRRPELDGHSLRARCHTPHAAPAVLRVEPGEEADVSLDVVVLQQQNALSATAKT